MFVGMQLSGLTSSMDFIVLLICIIISYCFLAIYILMHFYEGENNRSLDIWKSLDFGIHSLVIITVILFNIAKIYINNLENTTFLVMNTLVLLIIFFALIELNKFFKHSGFFKPKISEQPKKVSSGVINSEPIKRLSDDFIGFSAQSKLIKASFKAGAHIIGLIADYGSGKSSLAELVSLDNDYVTIKINLWDSLVENSTYLNGERNIDCDKSTENIVKSFLYQLAANRSVRLAKSINKRISGKYNIVSINFSSKYSYFGFLVSMTLYILYLLLSSTVSTQVSWHILILLSAIVIALITLSLATIAYSHKTTNGRVSTINDTLDIYHDIAKAYKTPFYQKEYLIVIEDLDRVNDFRIVKEFLKEIYRFCNVVSPVYSKQFRYLIAVKNEVALVGNNEDSYIYPKLFDYTIQLNTIHNIEFSSILKSIYEEQYAVFSEIFGTTTFDDNVLKQMSNIIKGQNLDIRQIKERINVATALYFTLHERNISIMNESYSNYPTVDVVNRNIHIDYQKCTTVAYLQTNYRACLYYLLKNENSLNLLILNCIDILIKKNSTVETEIQKECLKSITAILSVTSKLSETKKIFDNEAIMPFANDFSAFVLSGHISDDYRMYFYTYPKNSNPYTVIENAVYTAIINDKYPKDRIYNVKKQKTQQTDEYFNQLITHAKMQNEGRSISDAIRKLTSNGMTIPTIGVKTNQLLNTILEIDNNLVLKKIDSLLSWIDGDEEKDTQELKTILLLVDTNILTLEELFEKYVVFLYKKFEVKKPDSIVKTRQSLLSLMNELNLDFKLLAFLYNKNNEYNINKRSYPAITGIELSTFGNNWQFLDFIEIDNIRVENYVKIAEKVLLVLRNKEYLQKTNKSPNILEKIANIHNFAITNFEKDTVAPIIVDFMNESHIITERYLDYVIGYYSKQLIITKSFAELLEQKHVVKELNNQHLQIIDNVLIKHHLNFNLIKKLKDAKKYLNVFGNHKYHRNDDFYFDSMTMEEFFKALVFYSSKLELEEIYSLRLQYTRIFINEIKPKDPFYFGSFRLISREELDIFTNIDLMISEINPLNVEENNVPYIVGNFNKRIFNKFSVIAFYQFLLELYNSGQKGNNVANLIFEQVKLKHKDVRKLEQEDIDVIHLPLRTFYKLNDMDYIEKFINLFDCLPTKTENEIVANSIEQYVNLINKYSFCSHNTIDIIVKRNIKSGLTPLITGRLVQHGYRKLARENNIIYSGMNFETDFVNEDIELLNESEQLASEILKSEKFRKYILDNGNISKISKNRFSMLFAYPTNRKLIRYIFSELKDEQMIIMYLRTIKHKQINIPLRDFLIDLPINTKLLISIDPQISETVKSVLKN